MDFPRLRAISLIAVALVAAAGCGGSDSGSPVTPGPAEAGSAAPAPPATGATVRGTVSSAGPDRVQTLGAGLAGITISVSGTDLSATTGAGGGFTLRGVPPGLVRLLFQGAGASGSVEIAEVSQTEEISLVLVVKGSTIELESEERITGSEAQLEGKVVSANYAARTLVVGTTTVSVPEDTSITNGYRQLELPDVIVGARIHVKGARAGDSITASHILVQQTGLESVTLSGVVSDVTGSCPALKFKVDGVPVAVNDSTLFVKGACGNLTSGVDVEVKGLRRTDGSILATMAKFTSKNNDGDDADDDDADDDSSGSIQLSGAISKLSGSCPSRTFVVDSREVRTNGSTAFLTPCATLANGQNVEVKGKASGNGKVTASQVK